MKPDGEPGEGSYTTRFTVSRVEDAGYKVIWTGLTDGEMILYPRGDRLERSRGYFTDEPTSSQLVMVDGDTTAFKTSYSGQRFREEVRLIEGDKYRLRQTVGFDLETDNMTLTGQYLEVRQ